MRNSTVWGGLLGVEKSTVVDEVEFDDEAETVVVPVWPRKGARGRCGLCQRRCNEVLIMGCKRAMPPGRRPWARFTLIGAPQGGDWPATRRKARLAIDAPTGSQERTS